MIEKCIKESCYTNTKGEIKKSSDGHLALGSYIRSQVPIFHIHEAIKEVFVKVYGISKNRIYPPLDKSKPELKITGAIKSKTQDVCIVPEKNILKSAEEFQTYMGLEQDKNGLLFTKHTLIMNVRSQIVSIAKNTDTILERTFAESLNINLRDENIILGEFFLLPVEEICDKSAKQNTVKYNTLSQKLIERYISFFDALRDKECKDGVEKILSYSECCLILVKLSSKKIKIYSSLEYLKRDEIVSEVFDIEIGTMSFENVIDSLYRKYTRLSEEYVGGCD